MIKKASFILVATLVLCFVIPANAATPDLTGTWSYKGMVGSQPSVATLKITKTVVATGDFTGVWLDQKGAPFADFMGRVISPGIFVLQRIDLPHYSNYIAILLGVVKGNTITGSFVDTNSTVGTFTLTKK